MPRLNGHNTQGKGPTHHNWKGGTTRTSQGYVLQYAPDHPEADKDGYVKQHRLVVEQALGRRLAPGEHVHHINGVKDDNRPENLVALTTKEHAAIHGPQRKFDSATMRAAGMKGHEVRWGKKYT